MGIGSHGELIWEPNDSKSLNTAKIWKRPGQRTGLPALPRGHQGFFWLRKIGSMRFWSRIPDPYDNGVKEDERLGIGNSIAQHLCDGH